MLQYRSMFTKEELELVKGLLNSDINIPIKWAGTASSLKTKVEEELKTLEPLHEENTGTQA